MPRRGGHDGKNYVASFLLMGTVVTIRVVAGRLSPESSVDRAVAAMRAVEEACTRFDEASALRELCRHPGELMPVPPILYQALAIACEVADLTQGVFDPTVGSILERQGFNRHYLTGEESTAGIPWEAGVSYRDITLVEDGCRVRLERSMLLDLGAVAKGLAVDMAAAELQRWSGFLIDAGGDIFASGTDPEGDVWRIGIENPQHPKELLRYVSATEVAVCTSGTYKRRSPVDPEIHHLWDLSASRPAEGLLSCTVVGPQTVLADVMATAAFLLGPTRALPFIEDMGLSGLCVTADMKVMETLSMKEGRW